MPAGGSSETAAAGGYAPRSLPDDVLDDLTPEQLAAQWEEEKPPAAGALANAASSLVVIGVGTGAAVLAATLFNLISGELVPDAGTITLDGRDISSWSPEQVATAGLGRTFQNLALFRSMTVRENVLAGAHAEGHAGFLANALRLPAARREEAAAAEQSRALLTLLV